MNLWRIFFALNRFSGNPVHHSWLTAAKTAKGTHMPFFSSSWPWRGTKQVADLRSRHKPGFIHLLLLAWWIVSPIRSTCFRGQALTVKIIRFAWNHKQELCSLECERCSTLMFYWYYKIPIDSCQIWLHKLRQKFCSTKLSVLVLVSCSVAKSSLLSHVSSFQFSK